MAQVFVPLNRFQSVLASLTGEPDEIYATPAGVSSIMLSIQITNNSLQVQPVSIAITSNRELPVPSFEGLYIDSYFYTGSTSLANFSGSFQSASALLTLNRQFIRKEVAAYTSFQNNLEEIPFSFTSSRFEDYALGATDAIALDIKNSKIIRTDKEAKSYYNKNGINTIKTIYPEEYSASLFSLDYVGKLAEKIIQNQSVTGSSQIGRLYQTAVTQSFNSEFAITGSAASSSIFVITELLGVIRDTIETPVLVAQKPIELVTNITIPPSDSLSPVVSGKLVLEEGYGLIVSGSPSLSAVLSILESANE